MLNPIYSRNRIALRTFTGSVMNIAPQDSHAALAAPVAKALSLNLPSGPGSIRCWGFCFGHWERKEAAQWTAVSFNYVLDGVGLMGKKKPRRSGA